MCMPKPEIMILFLLLPTHLNQTGKLACHLFIKQHHISLIFQEYNIFSEMRNSDHAVTNKWYDSKSIQFAIQSFPFHNDLSPILILHWNLNTVCGMYVYTPSLKSEKSKNTNINKLFFGKVLHGIRGSAMLCIKCRKAQTCTERNITCYNPYIVSTIK